MWWSSSNTTSNAALVYGRSSNGRKEPSPVNALLRPPKPFAVPKAPGLPWYRGWAPLVLLPALVIAATPAAWPRWLFMWLLAFAIYVGCKWLTWRRTPVPGLPWWRHAGYLLVWPGLDAVAFLSPRPIILRPTKGEWLFAAAKTLGGAAVFWGASRVVPAAPEWLLAWCGMLGIAFFLHFGSFHLLSCFWRTVGVDAPPLMRNPWAATSVSEFWGQRWNLAFRDLTHRFLFRPLAGPRSVHAWLSPPSSCSAELFTIW